jgi:hypothetical protein
MAFAPKQPARTPFEIERKPAMHDGDAIPLPDPRSNPDRTLANISETNAAH